MWSSINTINKIKKQLSSKENVYTKFNIIDLDIF